MDFINIILILWVLLIILIICLQVKINNKKYTKEGFTPKIRSLYNPHLRNIRLFTESFLNMYNDNFFIKKLKNIGIY